MNTFLSNQTSITEQRAEESRRLALKLMAAQHTRDINNCLQAWVNRDCRTASSHSVGVNQQ